MNGLYAEAGAKPRVTMKSVLIKILLIAVAIIFVIIAILSTSKILLPVSAISVVAVIYFLPLLKVEYEYIFVDGQMDFDKIMGGSKRKRILRIDFEEVEVVAPEGSHALDSFNQLKVKNFSSLQPEITPYAMITRTGEERIKILFDPTEKMLEVMKMKSPRKIVNY
jgi:hypothetical protein